VPKEKRRRKQKGYVELGGKVQKKGFGQWLAVAHEKWTEQGAVGTEVEDGHGLDRRGKWGG